MILDKPIWTQGQRCCVGRKEAVYNVVQQYYKIASNEFCSSVQFLDLNPIIFFFFYVIDIHWNPNVILDTYNSMLKSQRNLNHYCAHKQH